MFPLEISKELCRVHQKIKNITELRTESKGKYFKNLLPRNESKCKRIIMKQETFDPHSDLWKGGNWGSQEGQKKLNRSHHTKDFKNDIWYLLA